jgi:hypothetical protein
MMLLFQQPFPSILKCIAVFVHNDDRVEVAHAQFMDKGSNIDMTQRESATSFLQVKSSMTMQEKL